MQSSYKGELYNYALHSVTEIGIEAHTPLTNQRPALVGRDNGECEPAFKIKRHFS